MTTDPVRISQGQARVLAELLRDAATNQQISRRLHITIETVKTQLQRLYAATGYHDRTALVRAVLADEITFTWTCQHCHQDDGDHHDWCRGMGETA